MTNYNRSIWLVSCNMENLLEILIGDEEDAVLAIPTYSWFKLGESVGWNTRGPLPLIMGPIRWMKQGFIGWLADFTVWFKDEPYPFMLRGVDNNTPQMYHQVNLTRVVQKDELMALIGVTADKLDNYVLWIEETVKKEEKND